MAGSCAPFAPAGGEGDDPATATFVSLNPCLDAILVEVAQPAQILALSHYSRDPASSSIAPNVAARHAFTGGTAEEVIALSPEIVLAGSFIAPETKSTLERAGMRVETFGSPTTMAQSDDQIARLAQLAGDKQRGDELTARIHAGPARPEGRELSALLWQPGQIVPGEATLIAQQLQWARLGSHSTAMGLHQADYVSLEMVLADPPDILLVAGDQTGQVHPVLSDLRTTMVAQFDPRLLYCAGPSIPRVRERLIEIRERYERDYYQAPLG